MLLLSKIVCCVAFCASANAAKILFTAMPDGKSHFGSMTAFAKRLLAEKHEVAVYFEVNHPLKISSNFKNHLVTVRNSDLPDPHVDPFFLYLLWHKDFSPVGAVVPWSASLNTNAHIFENQPEDFWRTANQTWDLIFVDTLFSVAGLTHAYLSKGPHAMFATSTIASYNAYFRGLGWSLVTNTPMYVLLDKFRWTPKDFWDRFYALKHDFLANSGIFIVEILVRRNIGWLVPDFSWENYAQRSSMTFTDSLDTLDFPMPRSNELAFVGTYCPVADSFKPLPHNLEMFVSDPKSKGTILLAFGTIVDWSLAPQEKVDALLGALKELKDYRIIWQFKDAKFELPAHITTMGWIPQPDLLNHPKTKLFVSHGGLKSLKETICASKPAVFLPLFAEQVRNALTANEAGFGGYLNKKLLTKDHILDEITKILNDHSYHKNAARIRSIWLDKVADSLDVGAFWVNKIIRKGGLPPKYFKPKPKRYLFQCLNLDLFSVLLLPFLVAASK